MSTSAADKLDKLDIDSLCINTIRTLSMDAVQRANSGHPGAPMGCASMAYVLWTRHLKHNPANPDWPDRDRFVLSNGHASMLLYSLLHLTGYDLPLEELENFRQWGSRTPGHPENFMTPGVETTTGPLGQGLTNAVGMALAEANLAARFNGEKHTVVDHHTWVICGDGDLMEGVTSEAASLAGHLQLGKLIVLYDDNQITIDGSTDIAFSEDVEARFKSYGWHTITVDDGNDLASLDAAMRAARADHRPSIVLVKTHIGYGSPNKQDTSSAHGSPLGPDEIALTKQAYGWPEDSDLLVPDRARQHMRQAVSRGEELEADWRSTMQSWKEHNPELASEFERRMAGELPENWASDLPEFPTDPKGMATRAASGKVLAALHEKLPELLGGSANLAGSNKTFFERYGTVEPGEPGGRNIHFGVREHAMGSICNGIALHGGHLPFGATFLVFSDYMRPAVRLGALEHAKTIWVWTHDSIGLGEDGPTHQPIEHLAALRAIPGFLLLRPADANETREAWKIAVSDSRPVGLALTRQGVPTLDRSKMGPASDVSRGAYVLADTEGTPNVILMATGSEVAIALDAREQLANDDIAARVVSMPCWTLFAEQDESYRNQVLPPSVTARVSIEAGCTLGWHRWVGPTGVTIGLDRFGASAPWQDLYQHLGLTAEEVVKAALSQL